MATQLNIIIKAQSDVSGAIAAVRAQLQGLANIGATGGTGAVKATADKYLSQLQNIRAWGRASTEEIKKGITAQESLLQFANKTVTKGGGFNWLTGSTSNKSAKESAQAFNEMFKSIETGAASANKIITGSQGFNWLTGPLSGKKAKESGNAFTEYFKSIEIQTAISQRRQLETATTAAKGQAILHAQRGEALMQQYIEAPESKAHAARFALQKKQETALVRDAAEQQFGIYRDLDGKLINISKARAMMEKELQSGVSTFLERTGSMMRSQISWFAGAGTIFAVVGAITAASKATLDFYQNLKNIQAVTGETDAGIKKISAAAIEVAKNTPIAASEASKLGLTLIQAGLDSSQAAEAMKTVAAVTTVSGEDMVVVSKAVTTAMFAWHKTAKDIPDIGNSIAAALNFSRLTVTDLGTAFNYLASTSSIMGRSLNETVSIMATLSNAGIRASTIGTGMSQLYTQLLVPTKQMTKELERMGISQNAINPQMNKFADIVELLTDKGFSAGKAMHLLGDRAGRQMAAAMVMGADSFREMEKKIENSKQLQEGLAKAMEGPINQMKSLRNQFEVTAIQIGAVGVPAFTMVIDLLKVFGQVAITATAGVSAIADIFGGIATAVFLSAVSSVLLLAKSFKSLKDFIIGAKTAQAAFNLTVLANPYVRVGVTVLAALSAIGLATKALRKDNEDLAGAYNAVKAAEEAKAKKNHEIAESSKMAEAAVTSLKEAWESAGKAEVILPFAQEMFMASLETAKLEDNLIRIKDALANAEKEAAKFNETNKDLTLTLFGQTLSLEQLKKGLNETKGFWANFFKDVRFLPKSWTEKKEPALSPEEQWIKDTNESFQRAMAELAERDKALLEQSKKREIAKALAMSPLVMARQTVAGAQAVKDLSIEEQIKAGEQKIAKLYEIAQIRLAAAEKAERGMTAATAPADREEILKELDAALVNWRAQGDAAERLADIIQKIKDSGMSKLAEQTEKYSNSLSDAIRDTARLRDELMGLIVPDSPYLKMRIQAQKTIDDLQNKVDKEKATLSAIGDKWKENNELLKQRIALLSTIGEFEKQQNLIGLMAAKNMLVDAKKELQDAYKTLQELSKELNTEWVSIVAPYMDSKTEQDKYWDEQTKLREQLDTARSLKENTKERTDALLEYAKAAKTAAREVKEGDEVIVSKEDAIWRAKMQVKDVQDEIGNKLDENIKQQQDLDEQIKKVVTSAKDFKEVITAIGEQMGSLKMEIDTSQAVGAIENVKMLLSSLTTAQATILPVQGGFSQPIAEYETGTSYVPMTGIYKLHEGERVLTRDENKRNSEQQSPVITITMGNIIIQGAQTPPEQLARELVKPIRTEMARLGYLQ